MARIGITYHDVTKAIATLQTLRKNPTVDHIREILGTGSKSTIARFLREWKAKHGLRNDDDGALPSDLLNIVSGLWNAMQEKAGNQTAESQKESEEKLAKLLQQLNQYKQLESDLQQKIHMLEEQLHKKSEEFDALKVEYNVENQEKVQMVERVLNLESRHQENQAENTRLHQLLKHVQENLEHYQAATQQLRQEQSLSIEKQRSEFDQQLSQLRSQLELISTEKLNYQVQCAQLNKNNESLENDNKTLALQYQEINQQFSLLKITSDKLQKDYNKLLEMHQQQSINFDSKHHAVIELQIKLKLSDEKIALLESDLSCANNKVQNLRHEHQFTSQEKANLEGQLKQLQSMLSVKKETAIG
ncbi:MAG: DNA-binding protein [Gammaproteobacteria bacterium]